MHPIFLRCCCCCRHFITSVPVQCTLNALCQYIISFTPFIRCASNSTLMMMFDVDRFCAWINSAIFCTHQSSIYIATKTIYVWIGRRRQFNRQMIANCFFIYTYNLMAQFSFVCIYRIKCNSPLAANEMNACACFLILLISVCWLLMGKRTSKCSKKSNGVTDEIFHFNLLSTISSHCCIKREKKEEERQRRNEWVKMQKYKVHCGIVAVPACAPCFQCKVRSERFFATR